MPAQLGELTTSFSVAAALAGAIFHRNRTGEGQLAHVALTRSSTFGLVGMCGMLQSFWPEFKRLMSTEAMGKAYWAKQLIQFGCYPTLDGQWIMHTPVTGPRLIHSLGQLGIKKRALATLVGTIVGRKLLCFKESAFGDVVACGV